MDDAERRRRIGVRHALADGHRSDDPVAAARSVVALHGTDPASIYMSVHARHRPTGASGQDDRTELDRVLDVDRGLVRLMAMRRTIWIAPAALAPAMVAGPGARVAGRELARLIKDVETEGLHADGVGWTGDARRAVLEQLADGSRLTMDEMRTAAPVLQGSYRQGVGKKWEADVAIAPRVLTWMWAAGDVVRAGNDGSWRSSRPRWASAAAWSQGLTTPMEAAAAWRELVRSWLESFGPGTETDIAWWLGATKSIVRSALGELGAVPVDLDDGSTGWVLPGDDGPTHQTEPWGALLPALDPTTMGWKQRDWYLGRHAPELVDSAGNAGPTVWWNGRIVGGWHQSEDGAVGMVLLDDVGRDAIEVLESTADELETWLGGQRVLMRFPSPLFQRSTGRDVRG